MINDKQQHIIVIGASAGGVQALRKFVHQLPADFNAPVFIVQHTPPNIESFLPEILMNAGKLKAVHPKDGDKFENGTIYIAPPDHHMLIDNENILVKRGPKENNFRPSVDALMRSAAYCYGPAVIGVVLTGMLYDGTSGLWSVKRLGGTTIIQNPEEAEFPDMPKSVLEYVEVDHQVDLSGLGALICELIAQPVKDSNPANAIEIARMKKEIDIAGAQKAFEKGATQLGDCSLLTCPDCGGGMVMIKEDNIVRYRCHTGHAYIDMSLLKESVENTEMKLWEALRCMEETIMILEQFNGKEANDEEHGNLEKEINEIRKRALNLHHVIIRSENPLSHLLP